MFQPGQSGNPKGKAKGTRNKATVEVQAWMEKLTTSKEYLASAERRILAGKAPHLESYILQKVGGKATERLEVSGALTVPEVVTFVIQQQAGAENRT